jgi:hypothetical protein
MIVRCRLDLPKHYRDYDHSYSYGPSQEPEQETGTTLHGVTHRYQTSTPTMAKAAACATRKAILAFLWSCFS